MSNQTEYLGISGNEINLLNYLKLLPATDGVRYVRSKSTKVKHYQVLYLNLEKDLTNITHEVISLYHYSRENHQKLLLCLIFETDISQEKIFYFQKLLNDTGGNNPLHRIVVTKDLYQTTQISATPFDYELRHIINQNSISISKQGQNYYFPYHLDDFQKSLLKTLFVSSETNKVNYLLGEQISDLDLAYKFKNLLIDQNQLFQINADQPDRQIKSDLIHQANLNQLELSLKPTHDLDQDLKIIRDLQQDQLSDITADLVDQQPSKISHFYKITLNRLKNSISKINPVHHIKNRGIKNKILSTIVIVFSIYLLCLSTYIYTNYQVYGHLKKSLGELKTTNLEKSVAEISQSDRYQAYSEYFNWTITPLNLLPSNNLSRDLNQLQSFATHLKNTLSNLHNAYILADKLYLSFIQKGNNLDLSDTILAINSNLSQVYENLIQLNLQLEQNQIPTYLVPLINQTGYSQELAEVGEQISETIKLLKLVPLLLPASDNTRIAVVVQDQDQLRGTGGVIRAILLLNLNNQQLESSNVYLESDIDSQMLGDTTADSLLTKSTGQTKWYLRDLDLNADFSQNAARISWYLQNTMNIVPQTVIAINQTFIQNLINNLNITDLPPIEQTLGQEEQQNLQVVLQKLLDLYQEQKLPLNLLAQTLTSQLQNGNIQLYSNNTETQKTLSLYPFSGTVRQFGCYQTLTDPNCFAETTYLNESNFSLASLNQVISRQTNHLITINNQQINHQYQLNYHFDQEVKNFNRDYKLVYQLFTPIDATLSAVVVDGQILNLDFTSTQSGELKQFNLPLALSLNQDHQVQITFSSPLPYQLSVTNLIYSITEIRQSGLTDNGYNLQINYPEQLTIKTLTHNADIKPSQVQIKLPPKNFTFGLSLKEL